MMSLNFIHHVDTQPDGYCSCVSPNIISLYGKIKLNLMRILSHTNFLLFKKGDHAYTMPILSQRSTVAAYRQKFILFARTPKEVATYTLIPPLDIRNRFHGPFGKTAGAGSPQMTITIELRIRHRATPTQCP